MSKLRVIVVEDQALVRAGMARVLDAEGLTVVDSLPSDPRANDALFEHRPDIAVLGVHLSPPHSDNGFKVAVRARVETPTLPLLILSQTLEPIHARELLADGRGGVGYLLRDGALQVDDFIDSVRRVARGGVVMDPQILAILLGGSSDQDPLGTLTERETRVLALMSEGCTNTAIANTLAVTDRTVGKCVKSVFTKLELGRDNQADRRVLAVLTYLRRQPLRSESSGEAATLNS